MLRLFAALILLALILRMVQPFLRRARTVWRAFFSPPNPAGPPKENKRDYSDLTPYEIEDADYEDISRKRE